VTAADGTRLYAMDCRAPESEKIPLLCLSGLTRNHRDFEPIFSEFGRSRRIIAPDYRGRGLSQHAIDPKSYRPQIELQDVVQLLDHLEVRRVAVIGTSRGGIIGMIMANMAQERMNGLLLVDIGPVIEVDGLKRIASYVGQKREFASWQEAALQLAATSAGFEDVSLEQWERVARRVFGERDGRPYTEHDPGLAATFPTVDALENIVEKPMADLWHLMPALNNMPCGLIHGRGSNLLRLNTVNAMQVAVPAIAVTSIPGRGHVPFLDETESVAAIKLWLAAVDNQVRRVRLPG
jgi:pimeloyl-ACP methyl ester carboxylesterase